ncbi:dipeptide/oligopeptide/nickel ABC transporter permease/ATP-binding protein [Sphaerisporangium sp. NPDC051011]|uniref:dipeptide/oligopeptide/nickel ABC transporter permease/ATP-binding protein n=1 Tax=Sphaerisporangium sp. NPDC051011 TaxID=3155792 RepID=UPI0033F5511D
MTRRRLPAFLRTPLGISGAAGVAVLAVIAVVAPILFGDQAATGKVADAQLPPSAEYWLGTDSLGRDVFARVLVATRLSLELSLAATALCVVAGVVIGVLPVVLGRRLGRLVTAVVDFAVAFPGLLLALFLIVIFGAGSSGAVLAVGLSGAPFFARLTHTLASGIAQRDYIAASRMLRVGPVRLLARHFLPNVAEPIVLNATIIFASVLQAFAALSFLGLGVQPPSYDWGQLFNEGLARIYVNPGQALGAAAAIVFAGLSFSALGEALSHAAGRRSGQGRRKTESAATSVSPAAERDEFAETSARLRVSGLRVEVLPEGTAESFEAVREVSFEIEAGESVGIVGESGSGKSLTASAIAGLLPTGAYATAGRIDFGGRDLRPLTASQRAKALGTSISMVFQDPMTALNPSMRVGAQLAEVVQVHEGADRKSAMARAVGRLGQVRIPAPARRARQFPHEMSGGMRQRAVIGIGVMGSPQLIIADEPTTALDVTVQRQVLDLLEQVRADNDASLMLISHDLGVVAQRCQRALVMYGGTIVEELTTEMLRETAAHPYTRALLDCVPEVMSEPGGHLVTIPGTPPEPSAMSEGCPFAARCVSADDRCRSERPRLEAQGRAGHRVACWYPQVMVKADTLVGPGGGSA